MVNLWALSTNALWILGLAVLLATWSYGYYEAQAAGRNTGEILGEAAYRLAILTGLLLFVVGMVLTDDRWWAKAVWVLIGAGVVAHYFVRRRGSEPRDDSRSTPD